MDSTFGRASKGYQRCDEMWLLSSTHRNLLEVQSLSRDEAPFNATDIARVVEVGCAAY